MSRYSPYGAAGSASAADDLQAKLGALVGLAALTGYGAAGTGGAAAAGGAATAGLGLCTKGNACNYSHSPEAALLGASILSAGTGVDAANGGRNAGRTGQYKGALCKFFQQSGTCSAGAGCTYAHGVQELAGGYKQRLCKFFEETGQCMKGEACTYAHGAAELLLGSSLASAASTAPADWAGMAGVQQAAPSAAEQLAAALSMSGQVGVQAAPNAAQQLASALATQADLSSLLPLLGGLLPLLGGAAGASASDKGLAQKTLPCKFWEMGQCIKGDACDFIHGPLRPGMAAATATLNSLTMPRASSQALSLISPPALAKTTTASAPALTALAGSNLRATPSGGQRKGALCKYFQQGVTCHAGSSCTYAHGIHELAGGFKQRICKFFDQTGQCSKGDSCTYAHGAHELMVGEALAGAMSLAAATSASEEQVDYAALSSGRMLPLTNVASSSSSSSDKAVTAAWQLSQLGQPDPSAGAIVPATTALDLSALTELAASLAQPAALGSPWDQLAAATAAAASDGRTGGQSNYKRALCKFWKESGTCSAGTMCTYAHGVEELVQVLLGDGLLR